MVQLLSVGVRVAMTAELIPRGPAVATRAHARGLEGGLQERDQPRQRLAQVPLLLDAPADLVDQEVGAEQPGWLYRALTP